ncbi:uncharacterized protein LOC116351750 [Contarinia nasturtii]|uniref:uncharacterized protein LOC116351750 n=1 Tax=Contarinia nasturtii TaxID=265458 RepID=UPI0012D3CFF0|nr:uncharacterized protein LOC116351750 [Contarinia nasturtii]
MASLYLGVRLPEKPFERLKLTNIDLIKKNVGDLKIETEKLLNFPHNELELIYCGTILENNGQSLQEYGVRSGTMIQVFQKQYDMEYKSEQATTEQMYKACASYTAIYKAMANSSTKAIRPEVMKQILEAYPEFHTNLGAYAILRDSILLQSMTDIKTVKKIGKEYPILIHSADFVSKTLREHLAANKPLVPNITPTEDSMSDSSSSESDSPTVSPNQRTGDIRQISRDQLAQALLLAGTSSSNSLSNIAQRNQAQSQSSQPSTSSATNASQSSGLISNSIFSNALSQALFAAGAGGAGSAESGGSDTVTSTQSTSAQPNPSDAPNLSSSNENYAERYANELQTMREMGLFEDMMNIQALIVSNGDVEAAINLVLSGLGNFN